MKNFPKRFAALLVLVSMILSMCMTLTGCGGGNSQGNGGGNGGGSGNNGGGNSPNTGTKVVYTVSVKTIGGRAIPDLTFGIYEEDDLKAYGKTDKNGLATVQLVPSDKYVIELSNSGLDGYKVEERYTFTERNANIVLTSSVIEDTSLAGVNYKLGDIMKDFSVETTDGSTFKLSEVLKTKKAVLINFWYSTCGPCVNEFPYLQSTYEQYKDDIEVIALNNYAADNEDTVKLFKIDMGLTFPVAKDYSTLGSAFNITGYPTSIMIDRYGTICLIEVGGLTSEKPFRALFEHFSADDYEQQLLESIDVLTPAELPNVEMPSSEEIGAAFNGDGFTAEYYPETESSNSEYSWPFLVGEKDGESVIYTSNSRKDNSYAAMHADVTLEAGQALAFDWFSDTELGVDRLIVLVDGKDIYQISGVSEDWQTCFPYVAVEDGTYKVSFIFTKDSDTDVGEDRVLLKNFRAVEIAGITNPTYIPRYAATKPNANGLGFQNYVTAVYSEADGYYHVGSENGPLLLVDLMGITSLTKHKELSLNDLGYNGELQDSEGDVYETLVTYCNYAINGTLYGYSPVTAELKALLDRAALKIGFEPENPNQWLQACSYYDAYATDGKQFEDPVKGVAFFAAFDTVLSTETELIYNEVEYDGRVIMPRGLKYKFVPTVSGAYIIKSQSADQVDGWIFNDKYEIIQESAMVDRPYDGKEPDTKNVSIIIYLKAGETYYIDIAYYDIYAIGKFTFTIEYIAETYEHFHLASPGYFTYIESAAGGFNQTIAGGIDVFLDEEGDGYYHELRADGTLGSIVYADFKYATALFSHSIVKMIELGGFDFRFDETGTYNDGGENLTEEIKAYLDDMITGAAPELEGCVAVDANLASLLQKLVDKYSFSGVDHSWTKLCYYYKSIAP